MIRKRFGRLYYRRHGEKTILAITFVQGSNLATKGGAHFNTEGHADQLFVGMSVLVDTNTYRVESITGDEDFVINPSCSSAGAAYTGVFTTPILGNMLASAMVREVDSYWKEFAKVEIGSLMKIEKGDTIGLSTGDIPVISENAKIEMNVLGVEESQSRVELMGTQEDRDFSAASAWVDVDLAAEGGSYNEDDDLSIIADVAGKDDYCELEVASAPTDVGLKYILKFDVANIVHTWIIKSFDGTQTIGIVSADGENQTLVWTATTTGGLRIVAGVSSAEADFDNFGLALFSTAHTIEGRWAEFRTDIHQKRCDLMFFTDNLSDPFAAIYSDIFGAVGLNAVASDLTRLVISADKSQGSFDETNLNIPLFTVESPVWTPASGAVGANAVIISCTNTRATVYWGKYDNEADLETDIDSGDAFSFHGSYVVTIDPNGTYQAQARMEGLTKSATVEAIYT